MIILKQSTASQVVWLGPFVDTAGAAVTGLSIANTDIKIRKRGSTAAVSKNSGGGTHDANGRYYCTFDATDTDTLGSGRVDVTMAGALAVWHHFTVVPAEVYDSLVSGSGNGLRADVRALLGTAWLTPGTAGTPDVNAKQIGGTSQTGRDIGASVLLSSGTGTGQLSFTSGILKVDVDTIKTQAVTCSAGVTVSPFVGSTGAAINGTNANTLSSHDPGATIGTSTLTQTQVSGGAYALNSSSFAFNAALDFTTAQKAATLARVTLVDTLTTYTGNTVQTGDSFARIGATGSGLTSLASAANLATVITHLTDIKGATWSSSTDTLEAIRDRGDAAWITATGFSTLTAADVNAEVVDALATDTYGEPTGAPGATVSLAEKIGRGYQALRNKITVTATSKSFYSDAGALLWSKALSDDGTTYEEAEGA